ncbi:8327_t:CDS:1, partial [Acaulospora morrowiae]
FCDICEKRGHSMRECHLYLGSQNLGKKARRRANRKNEKLLSNHIEKVDWKTIGKVNGLGKEKETLQTPKRFIKQELNEASIVEEGKCKKIVEGGKSKKIVEGGKSKKIVEEEKCKKIAEEEKCKKIVNEGKCKKNKWLERRSRLSRKFRA